jgi:hypothetical protein
MRDGVGWQSQDHPTPPLISFASTLPLQGRVFELAARSRASLPFTHASSPACRGARAAPHSKRGEGMERRAAHPKTTTPGETWRVSWRRDARLAALHCGFEQMPSHLPRSPVRACVPGMKSGHQRAPRTPAVVPAGRVTEAARERGCEPRARAPRQRTCGLLRLSAAEVRRRISSARSGPSRHHDAS